MKNDDLEMVCASLCASIRLLEDEVASMEAWTEILQGKLEIKEANLQDALELADDLKGQLDSLQALIDEKKPVENPKQLFAGYYDGKGRLS